jgi:hypothetical protein
LGVISQAVDPKYHINKRQLWAWFREQPQQVIINYTVWIFAAVLFICSGIWPLYLQGSAAKQQLFFECCVRLQRS